MKSLLSFIWRKERRDIQLLLILAVGIPLCWMIFLNWNFMLSISSNDATKILFPFYSDLVRAHGDWRSILYRPELLGGFIIEGYFGSYPITRVLASLGFSPLYCLNFTFLSIQLLYGFFSLRIALDLKEGWCIENYSPILPSHTPDDKSITQLVIKSVGYFGFGLLNTFLPVLAWRLSYGHPNIISGSFLFLSFFSLILAQKLENVTLTSLIITMAALINCFQYQSHQMVLYSIVFGAPILCGLICSGGDQKLRSFFRVLELPILLSIGSFAYSLEVFWPFLSHAISTDTARSILGQNITYSYFTSTLGDWLSSLPWSKVLLDLEGRIPFLYHEVNYPIGPILLLLALVPWRRQGKFRWVPLGIGLVVSACMALAFSMDLAPFSDLLSAVVPPLKFFRVPARSFLPLAFLIPILGSAALLAQDRPQDSLRIYSKESLIFVLIGFIVLLFPSEIREIFLWLICIFGVLQKQFKTHNQKASIHAGAFLLILGLGSLLEFKERLLPFRSESILESRPDAIKQTLYQQAPQLQSSLTRILLDPEAEPYSLNGGYMFGVSTLAGYFSPPARFLKLYYAFAEVPPEIMTQVFQFNENTPGYYPLRELYNVNYKVRQIEEKYQVAQLDTKGNEAWFSNQLLGYSDLAGLVAALKSEGPGLPSYLRASLAYLESDSMIVKANLPKQVSPLCSQARVLNVFAPQHSQAIDLKVSTPEDCPLTISMNFVEILEAVGTFEPGRVEILKVFPAYGALTGILALKGLTSIRLEPKVKNPQGVILFRLLGALLLLGPLGRLVARYQIALQRLH